ncbi:hypothetical protein M9458_037053, partial [Cirrhinus mrigala]
MFRRISRVDPLMDSQMCDLSTPPKPSTNTEEQHPHPCDETPVDAGEGSGQESKVMEKGKKKKKWWKETIDGQLELRSGAKAARERASEASKR